MIHGRTPVTDDVDPSKPSASARAHRFPAARPDAATSTTRSTGLCKKPDTGNPYPTPTDTGGRRCHGRAAGRLRNEPRLRHSRSSGDGSCAAATPAGQAMMTDSATVSGRAYPAHAATSDECAGCLARAWLDTLLDEGRPGQPGRYPDESEPWLGRAESSANRSQGIITAQGGGATGIGSMSTLALSA